MSILLIDNYDSFTFNLSHALEKLTDQKVYVVRNDQISVDVVNAFSSIVISPGPGLPGNAGIVPDVIRAYYSSKKMLGVCLGHQAIAEVLGGHLLNLTEVKHGRQSKATIVLPSPLFEGLPNEIEIGHYHSWAAGEPLPEGFQVTMRDSEGLVMAMQHESLPLFGLQFHPESVLTPMGDKILANWLRS
jgi:anthranilate synthase component 2